MEFKVNKYSLGGFIATSIVALPFLIYAHLLFSREKSEVVIFNYKLSHWLNDNETYIWMILNDLIPFSLLLLMFFTTRMKWKYFLFPLQVFYFLAILLSLNIFTTLKNSFFSVEAIIFSLVLVICILVFDFYIAQKHRQVASYANLQALIRQDYKLDISLVQRKLNSLHAERYNVSLSHYLKKLFYLHLILDKKLGTIYNSVNIVHKKVGRRIEKAIIILIILMNLIWFLPFIFPKGLMNLNLAGSTIDSNGFTDFQTFIWYITRKFIVIIFLSIWFITSEHWWKYAIFSPLILFSYQFWEAFQDVKELDALGNIKVFPLVLINILVVAGISKWIKYKSDLLLVYEVICKEVEDLFNEIEAEDLNEIARKYKEIKEGYQDTDIEFYQTKLRALEHELLTKLDIKKS
jgi:hypothetical protein